MTTFVRRISAFLLSSLVVAALLALVPAAYADGTGTKGDPWLVGDSGSNVTAYVEGSTLYVEGTGAMRDCSTSETLAPWLNYNRSNSDLTKIVVGEGVTELGAWAFQYCYSVSSVTFPNTLVAIDDHAFLSDSSLTKLEFPATITTIGDSAFEGCYRVTEMDFWHNQTDKLSIGYDAFLASGIANVGTIIYVPYSAEVNPALKGYDWMGAERIVQYIGYYGISKVTAPSTPTSVKAKSKAKKKATVTWKKPANATKYQVRYRLSGTKSWKTKSYSKSLASVTVSGLKSKKYYQFAVRAGNSKGWSSWSAGKTAKVK